MLAIGTNIQLELISQHDDEKNPVTLTAEVMDTDEEREIFFLAKESDNPIFTHDARFTVTVMEADGEVYQFETNVIKDASTPNIVFQFPKQMKRIQRRAFVRADINLPATIKQASGMDATVFNLSGGGMSMTVSMDEIFTVNDILDVVIYLREDEAINVTCKVVRLQSDADDHKQQVYVTFTDVDEADRRNIVYYCFQKQVPEYRKQR